MPATANYSATGNLYIDGVLSGIKWASGTLTFSFPINPTFYEYSREPGLNFKAFSAAQQTATRSILQMDASVANVTFTEITETSTQHATLRLAGSDAPSTAWAYYPSTGAAGGDAWFNVSNHYYDNPIKGNYGFLAIVHELGHALGLKHPHEASGAFGAMPPDHDSLEYSVMSYHSYVGSPIAGYTNEAGGYPQTLMMYDIAGLQAEYGANYLTNSGDTTYRWDPNTGQTFVNGVGQGVPSANRIFLTVWDGGGKDTYDFSSYSTNLNVNLGPGSWTTVSTAQLANLGGSHLAAGNIANALLYQNNPASLIENAIGGSGNDTIIGNAADNEFTGGRGNDFLDGAAGTNTARFSGSASDYSVTQNADGSWTVADLRAGAPDGTDTLKNIQYLNFSNSTLAFDNAPPITAGNVLTGNSAANILIGGGGSDTLDGRSGADKMYGGFGNDFYVVDNSGDIADETDGDGSDTILSSISFSLADPVHAIGSIENLTLTGTGAINATGNGLNNLLIGNSGNNVLAGLGGADHLDGGAGMGDTASYAASTSGVTVSLVTGTGSGGDAQGDTLTNIENLTGSNFDDTLEGAAGNNKLVGGLGIDTVSYAHAIAGTDGQGVTVNLAVTKAQKTIAAGTDTLSGFENLTGSQFNDTLTGTTAANVLIGLGGNDMLNGGAGADTMYGGTGNDTYVVDNVGDVANETDGDGTDTIRSSISFSLGDPVHAIGAIENLTLTGSSAINATSNERDNVLTGNSGANVLQGLGGADTLNGGAGADQMFGGTGNDTYVVDNAGDVVNETGGDGTDTVLSSVSFSLTDPVHAIGSIENLTLTGSGDRNATGNELDNVLIGNSGANVLIGGAGVDTLDGGGGTDTASYVTSASGVVVSLATGIGSGGDAEGDHLSNIERLIGSNFDDTLEGNAGNNKLVGGTGIDTVSYAHSTSANGQGVTVNLSLTSAQNTVTAGSDTLSGFENLTGSQFNDTLKGNAGDNVISGLSGNDKLTGAGGNDTFVFLPGFGKDTITDFTAGPNSGPHDLMAFDHTIFADFDAVVAASTQVGASTVITFHENTVTLANVSLSSLHHDDFAFV